SPRSSSLLRARTLSARRPCPSSFHHETSEADSPMTDSSYDVDLQAILTAAVELGASDVHLKAGRPPVVRFDGELDLLPGFPVLGTLELEDVVNQVGASSPSRLE